MKLKQMTNEQLIMKALADIILSTPWNVFKVNIDELKALSGEMLRRIKK